MDSVSGNFLDVWHGKKRMENPNYRKEDLSRDELDVVCSSLSGGIDMGKMLLIHSFHKPKVFFVAARVSGNEWLGSGSVPRITGSDFLGWGFVAPLETPLVKKIALGFVNHFEWVLGYSHVLVLDEPFVAGGGSWLNNRLRKMFKFANECEGGGKFQFNVRKGE